MLKRRDRGAISVAQAKRRRKAHNYLTLAGFLVGVLSVILIAVSHEMSTSLVERADSIRLFFVFGILLGPVAYLLYQVSQIAALSNGIPRWNYLLCALAAIQVSLFFARDILMIDGTGRYSLQTPQWALYILWSMLVFMIVFTLIVAIVSRKKV
ncbi:MAG: hypothetical protein QM447_07045 [Thermotogota bacterium]|nr:hypothetical protein [Thermotogota bacterium]